MGLDAACYFVRRRYGTVEEGEMLPDWATLVDAVTNMETGRLSDNVISVIAEDHRSPTGARKECLQELDRCCRDYAASIVAERGHNMSLRRPA